MLTSKSTNYRSNFPQEISTIALSAQPENSSTVTKKTDVVKSINVSLRS